MFSGVSGPELSEQLFRKGIRSGRVLQAMASVDRAAFIPGPYQDEAWEDHPVPIGFGQTISQPYIVAFMTEALALRGDERVLEIGTGCGYQSAVLAQLCRHVDSLEIVPELAQDARDRLEALGIDNVSVRSGDGFRGWPEKAPFDAIVLTAAPRELPGPLLAQLRPGGRLVAPVGGPENVQELIRLRKSLEGVLELERLLPVRFVPMTGEAEAYP
jgi:protein-L-isoaspartate(D-aspartate) O-methyltransferase